MISLRFRVLFFCFVLAGAACGADAPPTLDGLKLAQQVHDILKQNASTATVRNCRDPKENSATSST